MPKLDLNTLLEAHTKLGRVVTVCKSGEPTPEVVNALSQDLSQITLALSTMVGSSNVTNDDLKKYMGEVETIASALGESSYDLNLQDQIETLLEKVGAMQQALTASPAPADPSKDAPDQTAQPPAQPAVTTPAVAPPTDQTPPTVAPAVETPAPAPAPVDASASAAPPADAAQPETPAATDAPQTPPAADNAPQQEIVTKADLQSFGASIVNGFKEAMAQFSSTVLKADTGSTGRPTILPPAGHAETQLPREEDENCWGNQFDLNADD